MRRTIGVVVLGVFLLGGLCLGAAAGEAPAKAGASGAWEASSYLAQLDKLAQETDDEALWKVISDGAAAHPQAVAELLVPKLKDQGLSEQQQLVYVWALGLTKEQGVTDSVVELYRRSQSADVRRNCIRALASIGGEKGVATLLSFLDTATDTYERFTIFDQLAEIKCPAILPRSLEILQEDPKDGYWQPIFVFGKLGDLAVPFLLEQLNHEERNVRLNAINVLGQWLIPPEACGPLQQRYWIEADPDIRQAILSGLEGTCSSWATIEQFFTEVTAKEQDPKLVKFARETLDQFPKAIKEAHSIAPQKNKKKDPERFQREYTKLYESSGTDGDYKALGRLCSAADEPKLKALRERILQRGSDEAFDDYQQVTKILWALHLTSSPQPAKSPAAAREKAPAAQQPGAPPSGERGAAASPDAPATPAK